MSWSTFHTECMALTGRKHVSREQYSQKLSQAYHNCVMRHFDTPTAGGTVINTAPKVPALYRGFLSICEQNLKHHKQINWIEQVGVHILQYWAGAFITGPTGFVSVTSVGSWSPIPIRQNYDFNLILRAFALTCRVHMMTLTGLYTSTVTVPPFTVPWSGGLLQTIP
jgi:hypothetical protein